MQLGRQARTTGAGELIRMDARDQLRLDRRFEDVARLTDAKVPAVAEHVAESGAGQVRLLAPAGGYLGVLAQLGATVRGKGMGGEEGDLDARQVAALTQAIEDAGGFQLPVVFEVVSGLRLHGRRPALQPTLEPQGRSLLENLRRCGTRRPDRGDDPAP